MIIIIELKDGRKVAEDVRTVNIGEEILDYCRSTYYPGEINRVNLSEVESCLLINGASQVQLIW